MAIKVTYKGTDIINADVVNNKLKTRGKYLEDDITIVGEGGGQPDIRAITFTSNQVKTAAAPIDGYSPITVDVHYPQYNIRGSHMSSTSTSTTWTKPAAWPNIEALPYNAHAEGTVYMSYWTRLRNDYNYASFTVTSSKDSNNSYATIERGHMDGNTYISDFTYGKGSSITVREMFDNTYPEYVVFRVTGFIKTCSFATYPYTPSGQSTSRTLPAEGQCLIQRYGALKNATSVSAGGCRYLESDYLRNCKSLTSLSSCYSSCYNLQRVVITGWDTSKVTTCASMFYYCYNLRYLSSTANLVKSLCTNISNMFAYCRSLRTLDWTGWDTSAVTTCTALCRDCYDLYKIENVGGLNLRKVNVSTEYLFTNCYNLEGALNLSSWYLAYNLTDSTAPATMSMTSCFSNCWKVTSINITNWKMKYVTSLSSFFNHCHQCTSITPSSTFGSGGKFTTCTSLCAYCCNLSTINISAMNMASCTNMNTMFSNCYRLTTVTMPTTMPAGSASNSTAAGLFEYCFLLESVNLTIYDCSKWTNASAQWAALFTNDNNLVTLTNAFKKADKAFTLNGFALSRESLVGVFNNVGTVTGTVKMTIGPINLAKLTTSDIAIATGKGWTLA